MFASTRSIKLTLFQYLILDEEVTEPTSLEVGRVVVPDVDGVESKKEKKGFNLGFKLPRFGVKGSGGEKDTKDGKRKSALVGTVDPESVDGQLLDDGDDEAVKKGDTSEVVISSVSTIEGEIKEDIIEIDQRVIEVESIPSSSLDLVVDDPGLKGIF